MTDFYLARQPIYDRHTRVVGYELLHRSNEINRMQIKDGDSATSQVLISALLEMGLSEVVGDKLAFINITRNYIVGELPFPLARKQIVLEVLEDILPNQELLFALRQFKLRNAYRIALDDFEYDWSKDDLIPLADYIKLDVLALSREDLEEQLRVLGNFKGKLLAEKVEDHDTFEFCKELGFDLFQGFYFCRPQMLAPDKQLPQERLNLLRILAELQNPAITYTKLQAMVARDVTLTYRILRYINSAKFHLARPVDSIQQAITLLGLKTITTWITILVMARIDDKPEELMTIALIRAKMCETLAKGAQQNADAAFITGLFSTLDAMLDKSMPDITRDLPLSGMIKEALELRSGPLGLILGMSIAFERADWDNEFITNAPNRNQLTTAYFEAINWARDVRAQLLKAV